MVLKRKKDCDILIVEKEKWNYMEKSVQKVKYLADLRAKEMKEDSDRNTNKYGIYPSKVMDIIGDKTKDEAIYVTDVGQHQMWAVQYIRHTKPRSFITSGGLGTMGFCLPAAIGATFGRPDRTVCAFMGDGGLQMTIEELGTVMEQKSPVKIILLNNNYLGNVRQWQAMFFNRRYSFTPMMNPDYMKIAKAYGIPSRRVLDRTELREAIEEMLSSVSRRSLMASRIRYSFI